MAAENLGELEAGVKLVPETEAAEKAIADFSAKTKRQLESIGGQTLTQLTQNFDGLTNAVTGGLDAINSGIAKIRNVASLGFLGGGVAGIVNQIFQTRSYFQDAASSMKTFLGDADKAAKFTKELQEYAFYNMYEFQDLVGVSKQLIAYGTKDTKEIIQVTDQLSNIASGTGANIYEMVDIFNKIKARGTADGQVLQQLASRGLVVKDVLQQMGETVNGNKITFEQFQKVLAHVTGEGGMFHDLMKDQLNNLSASAAQLSDVMTNMWNEIGEQAEPYMKEAIDFAGMVVENYKEVAAVLFDIAKAYGVYKLVASGADWVKNAKEEMRIESLEREKEALDDALESTKELKNEDLRAEVAKNKLTQAEADEIAKLREQVDAENDLRVQKKELTEEQAKQLAIVKEGLLRREQELTKIKQQADEEVAAIEKEIEALEKKKEAQEQEVNVAKGFGGEGAFIVEAEQKKLDTIETQKQQLESAKLAAQKRSEEAALQKNTIATARETAEKQKNQQANSVLGRAMTAAGSAIKSIGSSIVSAINPMGLLVTAVGFLAEQFYEAYKAGSKFEQAERRLREAQEEADKEIIAETQSLAEYATTIKMLTKPSEEYAEQLKKLTEGTAEYDAVLEKSKIVNAQLGDAKKGLMEMTKKYNIETKETVNGVEQEMSALDLVMKKYDEYKQKIQDVANYKAYQNYIEAEKKRMQESIADFTSYLREDMVDVLLRGVKGDERGKMIAEINAAMTEYEISILENGKMPLGGKFKQLYDQYLGQIKDSQGTLTGFFKNAGKATKRAFQEAKDAFGGDMTWGEWWDNLQRDKSTEDYAQGYIAYLEQQVENQVAVSQSALLNARNIFKVTEDPLKEEEEAEKKRNANRYEKRIKNEKDNADKYIQEYAKLQEERYKALKKIDDDYSLDAEVKEYKKRQINAEYDFKITNGIDKKGLSDDEINKLTALYDKSVGVAGRVTLNYAEKKLQTLKEEIAKAEKEREDVLNTVRQTDENGNKLTSEQQKAEAAARQKRANEISAEIAKMEAQMLAYENVVKRQFDYTDYSKKAAAYEKFAQDYTASLIRVKEKELEAEKAIAELNRQMQSAESPTERADIQRQIDNKRAELQNFIDDEEMNRQDLVNSYSDTAANVEDIIKDMMKDAEAVAKQGLAILRDKINETRAQLRLLNVKKEMGEDVSAEIAQVTASLAAYESELKKAEEASQQLEDKKKIDYWGDSKKAVDQLASAFKNLGGAVGGSGKEMFDTVSSILTATTSIISGIVTFTQTSITAIKTAETTGLAAVKAVEAASVILLIISSIIQLGQAIASLFNKTDPIDELKDSLHDFNLELEETKRLAAQEESFKPFQTIFGDDKWGVMMNNVRIGTSALEEFNKVQQDIINNAETVSGRQQNGKGAAWWSGGLSLIGNRSAATAEGQYDNIDDTVANMKVKVKHKTWFRSEKSGTLKDFVPSLYDENGKLDKDALHQFVESNNEAFQKLSQENQDYLRQMDESWQQYQEAVQEVKDTFSDFFGSLGSEIQDVWTNAFRTGEDGLADFSKAWDTAIENMISSMAYNKTLGKIMSDMENELDKSGFFENPEGNMGAAIDIMEKYEQKAQESKTAYDAILQEYRDKGYFQEEAAQRNAVSGGISNISQDTAGEMNGRLTQIQSHTFAINENMKLMVTMQTTQLTILQGINSNTARLATIQGDITQLRSAVADIQIRGLKLKE